MQPTDPSAGADFPATTEWNAEAAWAQEDGETWDGDWDGVDWAAPEEAAPEPEPEPPRAVHNARPVTSIQTLPRPTRAAAPPPAPKAKPRRRRPRPSMRSRPASGPTRRWGRRIGALLALVAIGGALYVINATFQPFHGGAGGPVTVRIPEGSDAGDIGKRLADAGVVDSATFFNLNATLTSRRDDLQPGSYTLATGMSNGEALDELVNGPGGTTSGSIFKLTIPEGRSRREITPLVQKTSLEGSYLKATAEQRFRRRARRLGAPKGTRSLEGFLFPATYELKGGQSTRGLVDLQLDAFADNFSRVNMRYAKRKRLTRYDVLIIASMIEREAALARERPLISAVIYNRLKRGMPLGIDATIRYATNNWSSPIKASDLARDSAYNTRLRRGLPPTPIGNPGLSALKAAARPRKVSYLYYVIKPCGNGAHAFSSTEEGFNRDYERYERERKKRGKSPAKC